MASAAWQRKTQASKAYRVAVLFNARHHPRPHSTIMRDFVRGVGCMPLLCFGLTYKEVSEIRNALYFSSS